MNTKISTFFFVSPAVFLMLLLLIGPIISVFVLSFTDWQLGNDFINFIGFENYSKLFNDETFFLSFKNTIKYVAIVLPISVIGGLFVAILIESDKSAKGFYRTIFFLPVMATLIAMSIVWEYILQPDFGILNKALAIFGVDGTNWLSNKDTVLYVLAGIGIWHQLGYNMVLFTAGLMSIPRHLYEAASMDGVSDGWGQFRLITWPLLGPVLLFVIVITSIKSFQVFDTVAVLTSGGPNKASEVLIYTIYQEAFAFFRTSYAAAISVVFLFFILVLTVIKIRYLDKRTHY